MTTEGREGSPPLDPTLPLWNVDCLDACGAVYQIRCADRPTKCGVCGGHNLLATPSESNEPEAITYRRPGKPRSPIELKKTEKIIVSVTAADDRRYRVVAAQQGYKNVNDWARDALENAATRAEKPRE